MMEVMKQQIRESARGCKLTMTAIDNRWHYSRQAEDRHSSPSPWENVDMFSDSDSVVNVDVNSEYDSDLDVPDP